MPVLNIEGRRVRIDDSITALSPDEQNSTVDEIASNSGAGSSGHAKRFLMTAPDGKKYRVTGENAEGALGAVKQMQGQGAATSDMPLQTAGEVDLAKVKRNVSKMVGMGAPESDIDAYISQEGTTVDAVRFPAGQCDLRAWFWHAVWRRRHEPLPAPTAASTAP